MNTCLHEALICAKKNWFVLPLHSIRNGNCSCGKLNCQSPGKHPRTPSGLKDATTEIKTIQGWWEKWEDANLGIATGRKSELVVLDIDPRHNGNESLVAIEEKYGPFQNTITAFTGGGGYHMFFRHPLSGINIPNAAGIAGFKGIDIRGDGGYVVSPPSNHINGTCYAWDTICHPKDTPLALLPAWLLGLSKNGATPSKHRQNEPGWATKALKGVGEGSRDNTCIKLAGYFRNYLPKDVTRAILLDFAAKCSPCLPDTSVDKCLAMAYTYDGPQTDKTDITDIIDIIDNPDTKLTNDDSPDITHKGREIWKCVDQWMAEHAGERFDLDTICRQLDIFNRSDRHHVVKKLSYEVSKGNIEKTDKFYRLYLKLVSYINWADASPLPPLPIKWPYGIRDGTKFDFAEQIVVSPGDIIVLAGLSNQGKALTNSTNVLMPDGWKSIADIEVGDKVYTPDGDPTKVIGVYPQGMRHCYRLIFNDGSSIDCDAEHLWKIQLPYARTSKFTGRGNPNTHYQEWVIQPLSEIIRICGEGKLLPHKRITIPSTSPVEFPYKWVPMEPYVLGLLLGDGHFAKSQIRFSTVSDELLRAICREFKVNYAGGCDYRVLKAIHIIRELHLDEKHSYDKFIPQHYLWNDYETRYAILQGLMDTDGSIGKDGTVEYSTASLDLAEGVKFLVQSLGGRVTMSRGTSAYHKNGVITKCRDRFRLRIKMTICPFRLMAKRRRFQAYRKTHNKILYEIQDIGDMETTCIKIGDKEGLFIAQDFIVTHNTALCLNLLWNNMDSYPCTLMGNEYEAGKFRRRVANMTWANPLNNDGSPKFELIARYDNWQDIIRPDNINIIDWINLGDNFYQIGKIMEGIRSKLRDGIAIVALQKSEGKTLGLGGSFSEHLASVYLAIDRNRLTVTKAKEWFGTNPNGKTYGFQIGNAGTQFSQIREVEKCKGCNGSGNTMRGECQLCRGNGFVDKRSL